MFDWLSANLASENRDDPAGIGSGLNLSNRLDEPGDGRLPNLQSPACAAKLRDPASPCFVRVRRFQCLHRALTPVSANCSIKVTARLRMRTVVLRVSFKGRSTAAGLATKRAEAVIGTVSETEAENDMVWRSSGTTLIFDSVVKQPGRSQHRHCQRDPSRRTKKE